MSDNPATLVETCYSSSPKYSQIKAGVPEDFEDITTLRDLLAINFKLLGVKEQLRQNLISKIKSNGDKYPGIIGFESDVFPSLDRAILSGHDIFLIGQIGQAKTRLAQTIAEHLLSPIPVIQNSITNDCPMDLPKNELISLLTEQDDNKPHPKFYISPESEEKIKDNGLDTKIEWIPGRDRFKYILATPDISVKDLVGFIDAVKVAKKGIEMHKIESYSPGQLMQAKHGIFCLDELPVLDTRKQVALLSVLQEGRFTTGSYPVIFEPRTAFIATANPIDYTHSGKIIEPLYDRLKSHIHTHYPTSIEDEMSIILQEAKISESTIPFVILRTLAALIQKFRMDPRINQEKGVSVRLGVHGLELMVGEAERTRAIMHNLVPLPRLSDMYCLEQVTKFELAELDDNVENRKKVFRETLLDSIKESCLKLLEGISTETLDAIKNEFGEGSFSVSQQMIWKNGTTSYSNQIQKYTNLSNLVESKLPLFNDKQAHLESILAKHSIKSDSIRLEGSSDDELRSLLLEMILEGLCWTSPKVLDKKESNYVSA